MNLAGFDLNLLIVFDAMMREKNTSRAGQRIGMSQPAVSKALGRLRHHLKDELFIRTAGGMQPTARALEMAPSIRDMLSRLDLALDPTAFDPLTSTRTFSLSTNDYVAVVIMPRVMTLLAEQAPGVNVRLVPSVGRSLELLDQQEIDFILSPLQPGTLADRFHCETLLDEKFVVIMRKSNPLADGSMSLEDYANADHLMVTLRGDDHSFVDVWLADHGLKRRVILTVNQFLAGPPIVAATDTIMTLPRRLAETCLELFDLVIKETPVRRDESLGLTTMTWHRQFADHPAHIWFRDILRSASAKITPY